MEPLATLPPYPDAEPALQGLAEKGFRLAVLTNGTAAAADRQLHHAGLHRYFDQVLSADEVRRYKPAAAPYHLAARRLGVEPAVCRLIAAHGWDLAGARAAGLSTAFVQRPGQVLDPSAPVPDLIAADLEALVALIRAQEGIA